MTNRRPTRSDVAAVYAAAREQRLCERRPGELLDVVDAGVEGRRHLLGDAAFEPFPGFGATTDEEVNSLRTGLVDVMDALWLIAERGDLRFLERMRDAALDLFDAYQDDENEVLVDMTRTKLSWRDLERTLFYGAADNMWLLPEDERTDDRVVAECVYGVRTCRGLPTDLMSDEELHELGRAALHRSRATSVDRKVAVVLSTLLDREILVPSRDRVAATRRKEPATKALEELEVRLRDLLSGAQPSRLELARLSVQYASESLHSLPTAGLTEEERVQRVLARWGSRNFGARELARGALRALGYTGGFIQRAARSE